jgi:protein TonB
LVTTIKLRRRGLKGKVYVTFVVEKDGSLTDIKVRDIGYGTGKKLSVF